MLNDIPELAAVDNKRFIVLGWKILEAKYRYYILDEPILSDHEYDMIEREYDELAKRLGRDADASNMVGIDMERPSCRLIERKVLRLGCPDTGSTYAACPCDKCKRYKRKKK